MSEITFGELVEVEPRLDGLLAEADSYHVNRPRGFCANAVWYGYPGHQPGLKERMAALVGHLSGQQGALAGREAYDVAYRTIYQALPNCRHRGMCRSFAPKSKRKPTLRICPALARFPVGSSLLVRMSDIPEGAERGDIDPDTPMKVQVSSDAGDDVLTVPIKEVYPGASRNWQGVTAR